MIFKELTPKEGVRFFPKVWNLNLTLDPNYFPNIFADPTLRFLSFIKKESSEKITSYLYLNEKGCSSLIKFIRENKDNKLYLSGSYNQVNVCIVRVEVKVEEITSKQLCLEIINLLKQRIIGQKTEDQFLNKPDKESVEDVLRSLMRENGRHIFMFNPIAFSYYQYERG